MQLPGPCAALMTAAFLLVAIGDFDKIDANKVGFIDRAEWDAAHSEVVLHDGSAALQTSRLLSAPLELHNPKLAHYSWDFFSNLSVGVETFASRRGFDPEEDDVDWEDDDVIRSTFAQYVREVRNRTAFSREQYVILEDGQPALTHPALRHVGADTINALAGLYPEYQRSDLRWNLFLGGAGSATHLHFDPVNINVLYVITGKKLLVQCRTWRECQSVHARQNAPPRCGLDPKERWNSTCWPHSIIMPHVNVLADPPPTAETFVVGPGQAVRIAPQAYHAVFNLEASIAVSIRETMEYFGEEWQCSNPYIHWQDPATVWDDCVCDLPSHNATISTKRAQINPLFQR